MSLYNWFNKMFGINDPKSNTELPSEFRLPTENTSIDVRNHNIEHNDIDDPFIEMTYNFEEHLNNVFTDLGDMLKGLHIPSNNSPDEDAINFINNRNLNQSLNKEEYYNGIPKKNFIARDYFLSSRFPQRTLNEPATRGPPPRLDFGQSKSSCYTRSFENRSATIIEKETTTRQLPGGITEHVTVLKDGNKKCITTIRENPKTGVQNCHKELINLDESELNEFENRFSKLRWW